MSPASELQPPPEGVLIRLARQARGLSPEAAAELTPIQIRGGRWRQIESGYERKTPPKRAYAPDLTLAHMAHTVGVTPERLEGTGRTEAAEILREIIRSETEATPPPQGSPTLEQELELGARLLAAQVRELRLSPEAADEAWRRARERIIQTHQAEQATEGPPETPRSHRAG